MSTLTVRIAAVLHLALALGLVLVPLFAGLGFERSLATGLLAAVTSPLVTISLVRQAQRRGETRMGQAGRVALITNLALLLPSLVTGALVEAIQQPCEPDAGVLFMLLIAGGNVAVGTALGLAAVLLRVRAWAPRAIVAVVLVGALVGVLSRFYTEPQIFIFSSPWGFWPGSVYDEALAVDVRLWSFRAYSTLLAGAVFYLAVAFTDERLLATWKPQLKPLAAALLFASGAAYAHQSGHETGWNLDRASVQQALRTRVETEHFIIHVDPSVSADRLKRIVEDHEHRYQQLIGFFEAEPNGKVTSFVYRDRNQKARLMGARRTQIARPWAREIHIDGFTVPHRVLNTSWPMYSRGPRRAGPSRYRRWRACS